MLVVICFDVADDRRRRALVRILEHYGFRVQESVFECWLEASAFACLKLHVSSTMVPAADSVIYYRPESGDGEFSEISDSPQWARKCRNAVCSSTDTGTDSAVFAAHALI